MADSLQGIGGTMFKQYIRQDGGIYTSTVKQSESDRELTAVEITALEKVAAVRAVNGVIKAQIKEMEDKQHRAVREVVLKGNGSKKTLQDIDNDIAILRGKLQPEV
jgi:hypothetical protein